MPKVKKPDIITRTMWGANGARGCHKYTTPLKDVYNKITIHHEARVCPPNLREHQGYQRLRGIQALHFGNGWCDIGYHYVIDPMGRIYSGRSLHTVGSHAADANTGNLGICLLGNFEEQKPTDKAYASLCALIAWFCQSLEINEHMIYGHRQWNSTACPGKNLFDRIPGIVTTVEGMLR